MEDLLSGLHWHKLLRWQHQVACQIGVRTAPKPTLPLRICRGDPILTGECILRAGLTAQLCLLHLLQDHDIYHKRLTGEGVPIDEGTKAKMIGPETNLDLMHTEEDATNTTAKCGSCYGAQARDEDCCNNCEEVGPAAAASTCGCAQPCLSWPGQSSICHGPGSLLCPFLGTQEPAPSNLLQYARLTQSCKLACSQCLMPPQPPPCTCAGVSSPCSQL